MRYDIKRRLIPLGKTLTDLHIAVRKTGQTINYSDFCRSVNGKLVEPRADRAVESADEVLKAWEKKGARRG